MKYRSNLYYLSSRRSREGSFPQPQNASATALATAVNQSSSGARALPGYSLSLTGFWTDKKKMGKKKTKWKKTEDGMMDPTPICMTYNTQREGEVC